MSQETLMEQAEQWRTAQWLKERSRRQELRLILEDLIGAELPEPVLETAKVTQRQLGELNASLQGLADQIEATIR